MYPRPSACIHYFFVVCNLFETPFLSGMHVAEHFCAGQGEGIISLLGGGTKVANLLLKEFFCKQDISEAEHRGKI